MARARKRLDTVRVTIIGGILIVVLAVLGFGILYSAGFLDSGEAAEGTHYTSLDRPVKTDPIEVVEFFSYACIHCRNFDRLIKEWATTIPDGVVFRQAHVSYAPSVALLAKAHATLTYHRALEQNNERIFKAIHDRGKQFTSPEMIADFVDGFGIDRETFLRTFNSPRVASLVAANGRRFIDYGFNGVPALVVADKYVMDMNIGRVQSLAAVDQLIVKLRAGAAPD